MYDLNRNLIIDVFGFCVCFTDGDAVASTESATQDERRKTKQNKETIPERNLRWKRGVGHCSERSSLFQLF